MFRRLLVIIFVVVIALTVLISCGKKPTEPESHQNTVVVNDNVVDLNQTSNLSDPVINGDVYTYSYTGTPPTISIGDVLVGQTGYGYMRKVTSVQTQNNQIVCQTDSARVTEVIRDCSIRDSVQLNIGGKKGGTHLEPTFLADGVSLSRDGGFNISSKILFINGQSKLEIKNSTVDYDPSLIMGLDIDNFSIVHLSFIASGTLTKTMTVKASYLSGYNLSVPIMPLPIAEFMSPIPVAFIGPVPVFAGVEFNVGYELVTGTLTQEEWTIETSETMRLGVNLIPNVEPVIEHNSISQITQTELTQNAGTTNYVKASIIPRVKLLIGGVIGPKFGPEAYLKFQETTQDNTIYSKLSGGVGLKASITLSALSYEIASVNLTVPIFEGVIDEYQTQIVATPTFNPPGGSYTSAQNVTISCPTSDASIRYTTNGSDPTTASTLFTTPISISANTTVKARAYKPGWTSSPIASAAYTISPTQTVATPTFNPPSGTYTSTQNVLISCNTNGATIRFTIDGSNPTTSSSIYTSPISLSSTTTLKARAFKTGWTASNFVVGSYNINIPPPPRQMMFVQGGTFNLTPTIIITLSAYYICNLEVTQSEYQIIMGVNPSYHTGNINRPVDSITWFNAIEYCNRKSIYDNLTPCYSYSTYGINPDNWPSGWDSNDDNHTLITCNWIANGYRLPTNMEWQFAKKGGNLTNNYIYSGSDDINAVAWYFDNSGFTTHTVGIKAPNELGIYDMHGNVTEWSWDRWNGTWPDGVYTDPTGPTSGDCHGSGGGSAHSPANECLLYIMHDPTNNSYSNGFRICKR